MDTDKELRCVQCGVEVTWSPYVRNGQAYCCELCADGHECACDYPPEEE